MKRRQTPQSWKLFLSEFSAFNKTLQFRVISYLLKMSLKTPQGYGNVCLWRLGMVWMQKWMLLLVIQRVIDFISQWNWHNLTTVLSRETSLCQPVLVTVRCDRTDSCGGRGIFRKFLPPGRSLNQVNLSLALLRLHY